MTTIRQSIPTDIDQIMDLFRQARAHLKRLGIDQWQGEYPDQACMEEDIATGNGYVMTDNETIIGYLCICFDGEVCYEQIAGAWKSIQPYAVIHRLVIDDTYKGKGLSQLAFQFTEQLCQEKNIHSIKIDTDQDNHTMQHLLKKFGYEYCGIVQFANSDKIAFEKLL